MHEAVGDEKRELSQYAPRMLSFKINPEKIRDVIGKGGAVIRAITEETGVSINIEDDGSVTIASADQAAADEAKRRIDEITVVTLKSARFMLAKSQRFLTSVLSFRFCREEKVSSSYQSIAHERVG